MQWTRMDQDRWTGIDRYLTAAVAHDGARLDAVLERGRRAGLPAHDVSPNQGKLLQVLARMVSATAILEIGTLAGYSTAWLAAGLAPGGRVVTLESDPRA